MHLHNYIFFKLVTTSDDDLRIYNCKRFCRVPKDGHSLRQDKTGLLSEIQEPSLCYSTIQRPL